MKRELQIKSSHSLSQSGVSSNNDYDSAFRKYSYNHYEETESSSFKVIRTEVIEELDFRENDSD
jgi:hypothetical protein